MKPTYSAPAERVIEKIRGPIKRLPRPRRIALWWPRDENNEQRLAVGHASEHLRPHGIRYRRYVRLRQRLRVCERCQGSGQDPEPNVIPHVIPVCCGRSEWGCGGRGCEGPVPFQDVEYQARPCASCGGFGIRTGNRSGWRPGGSGGWGPPP